jgi:RTX calcium-binding nonapeptide repeat (4 copies)
MANNTAEVLRWDQSVAGYSQSALGDEWWKTVYTIPKANHFTLSDDQRDPNEWRGRRGSVEKAAAAQFGNSVLFIGGAYGELSIKANVKAERTIVLPNNGKATVFLPLLSGAPENLTNDPPKNSNLTVDGLRGWIYSVLNTTDQGGYVSSLFASVDGKSVANLTNYRQKSQRPFDYTTPYPIESSLLSTIGYTDESYLDNRNDLTSDDPDPIQIKDLAVGDKVTISPVISDGYWLAVNVTGGDHSLNFGGSLSEDGEPSFQLDITYNILNPIYGTAGRDNLNGSNGNDYIDGGCGSDKLMGLKGDDLIVGNSGNDLIEGGKGNDELWGDLGVDQFIFKRGYGQDTIFDLTAGETIEISGLPLPASKGISEIQLNNRLATQINFGNGDALTLVGVQPGDLNLQRGLITR